VNDWAESDLAWELAEVVGPVLADRDRDELYVTIGSGSSYAAIDTLLQMIVQRRLPVSVALVARIDVWSNAYVHSGDAPRLHELLDAIRSLPH
jgi:hypothetical protein